MSSIVNPTSSLASVYRAGNEAARVSAIDALAGMPGTDEVHRLARADATVSPDRAGALMLGAYKARADRALMPDQAKAEWETFAAVREKFPTLAAYQRARFNMAANDFATAIGSEMEAALAAGSPISYAVAAANVRARHNVGVRRAG